MRLSVFVVVVAASFLTACGGGGGSKSHDAAVDAKPIDGAVQVQNALGQLCPFMTGGGGTPCPAGNLCVKVTNVGTNANTGYCTPDCMAMDAKCAAGYTGPAGGVPKCVLSAMGSQTANGCAVICTDMTQCPTGMSCTTASGTTKICVPT